MTNYSPGLAFYKKLMTLLLPVVLFLATLSVFYNFTLPPFEDAAMIMRYADHIAAGHGMVWNIGEPPVDGATDFLFTLMVAGLVWLGTSAELAVRSLTMCCHLFAFVLIYFFSIKLSNLGRITSLLISLYFLFGPGISYIGTFFGTPVFALFVLILWLMTVAIANNRDEFHPVWYALTALIVGLIRPEGVLLGFFMIASLIWFRGWYKGRNLAYWYLGIMFTLGGCYLVWRWSYFGFVLPNPFYKKGGFELHIKGLVKSVYEVFKFGWPYLVLAGVGLMSAASRRRIVFHLLPTAAFTLVWILISDEMNFAGRFQYPLFGMMLVSIPQLLDDKAKEYFAGFTNTIILKTTLVIVILVFIIVSSFYLNKDFRTTHHDGRIDAARILAGFKDRGYRLATSEAGILPYYSGWRSLDTWGLNDWWIAHHGMIDEVYLSRFDPDLMMFHGYFSPLSPIKVKSDWDRMTVILNDYAISRHYRLVACFGVKENDSHFYYLKPGIPDETSLVQAIKSLRYGDYRTGAICTNFGS